MYLANVCSRGVCCRQNIAEINSMSHLLALNLGSPALWQWTGICAFTLLHLRRVFEPPETILPSYFTCSIYSHVIPEVWSLALIEQLLSPILTLYKTNFCLDAECTLSSSSPDHHCCFLSASLCEMSILQCEISTVPFQYVRRWSSRRLKVQNGKVNSQKH